MFAKAYTNKEWYVKVGNELPKLSHAEIEREAVTWGLTNEGEKIGRADHIENASTTSSPDERNV